MLKNKKKQKISKLKKEIEVKDFIIKELMVVITDNKVILPDVLLKNIHILYSGELNEN